jgi:hypothetical protein
MADYPGAIDYPADKTNVLNPPGNVPKGWCLHTPEEPADNYPGTPVWFAQPNVGGSTTYFVSYLGFVFQCVPENVGAIANGVTADRDYPAWADPNVSLNRQTLSVEIEGYAATIADTISPAQKTALLNLLAYGCQKYGIPKDRAHIIGHYQVASNRSDPGTLDIDALVAELQEDDMGVTQEDIQRWNDTDIAVKAVLLAQAKTDEAIKEVLANLNGRLAALEDHPESEDSIAELDKRLDEAAKALAGQ